MERYVVWASSHLEAEVASNSKSARCRFQLPQPAFRKRVEAGCVSVRERSRVLACWCPAVGATAWKSQVAAVRRPAWTRVTNSIWRL